MDPNRTPIDPESVQLLGYGFCKKKQVVVLGKVDPDAHDAVTVGMTQPEDAELLSTLRSFFKRPIEPVAMRAPDLLRTLDAGFGIVATPEGASPVAVAGDAALEPDDPIDARVLDLLQRARIDGAEAVHLCPEPQALVVRARVDGVLRPLPTPIAPEQASDVVARLAALAGLSSAEPEAIEQGTFTLSAEDPSAPDVKVSVTLAFAPHGPELVLRIAKPTPVVPLDAIGLDPAPRELVRALLCSSDGLVLVAGCGRSGRSTILRSLLAATDVQRRRVIALDPEEIAMPGVDVRAPSRLGNRIGEAIRSAEALDADVIGIDPPLPAEGWKTATQAAERGRLVLANVHAIDAVGAIDALDAADVPRHTTATLLRGAIASRVLSRNCPHCRTQDADGRWHAAGCERCGGTGIAGRIAIYEVLWLTPGLADDVAQGAGVEAIRARARADGMTTLMDVATARMEMGELSEAAVRAGLPLRLLR